MKIRHIVPILYLAGSWIVGAQTQADTNAAVHAKTQRPSIYDESADGSKQIAEAVVLAGKEHKRVLLQFGANWCGWCHKLHTLFETDKSIAQVLRSNYVVALIDVNERHNEDLFKKYSAGGSGIPFIVILDTDGKYLHTQHTAVLEEGDHHSPQKVLAFLNEWTRKSSKQ
jgi:thiol:disulfide interchange protein